MTQATSANRGHATRRGVWAIVNGAAYLLMLTLNGLANALPINGVTTGEVSKRYPVLFTPPGYVFSIWGLIYLMLLGFVVFQALPRQRTNARLSAIGPLFAVSSLCNAAWIVVWHYGMPQLALVLIVALLFSLALIVRRFTRLPGSPSWPERVFVVWPFSVYLGWLSVATIANTSIVLYASGWQGWGGSPALWTGVVIGVASTLGLVMAWQHRDAAFNLVLVWAFTGIAGARTELPALATVAWIAAALAGFAALASLVVSLATRRRTLAAEPK